MSIYGTTTIIGVSMKGYALERKEQVFTLLLDIQDSSSFPCQKCVIRAAKSSLLQSSRVSQEGEKSRPSMTHLTSTSFPLASFTAWLTASQLLLTPNAPALIPMNTN